MGDTQTVNELRQIASDHYGNATCTWREFKGLNQEASERDYVDAIMEADGLDIHDEAKRIRRYMLELVSND